MSDSRRAVINKLPTGVPGLDTVLGGGLPEYSFNLIAGAPGTGKTTLAQQIMFANATRERPALHFTVLGEPPLKLLRYQQQFRFFDLDRVGRDVRFLNLSQEVLERDLDAILERIVSEVEQATPSIVVVDSFRTVLRATGDSTAEEMLLRYFVQRLALRLTGWETTSFLLGEYLDVEARNPVFTVADGIVWLHNMVERNSHVRKLQAMKIRGQAPLPGLHTFRITGDGLEVFPRLQGPPSSRPSQHAPHRVSTGVAELDAMTGGGFLAGDSVLVTGPTGTGKTILGMSFITEGHRRGEAGVIAVFEERPSAYLARAKGLGFDLEEMVRQGRLEIMYLRPLDLSVEEALHGIQERVRRLDAKRLVIDSLSGFEVSLAPSFREDFRESFYRLLGTLSSVAVTVVSTLEVGTQDSMSITPYEISFLSDTIIAMRFVELEGLLRRVLTVIKMRGSAHSTEFRAYDLTGQGLVIREALRGYRGIVTGVPEPRLAPIELTPEQALALDALLRLGETEAGVLANEAGQSVEQVERVLAGLVGLGYISRVERDGKIHFRATPYSLRR